MISEASVKLSFVEVEDLENPSMFSAGSAGGMVAGEGSDVLGHRLGIALDRLGYPRPDLALAGAIIHLEEVGRMVEPQNGVLMGVAVATEELLASARGVVEAYRQLDREIELAWATDECEQPA